MQVRKKWLGLLAVVPCRLYIPKAFDCTAAGKGETACKVDRGWHFVANMKVTRQSLGPVSYPIHATEKETRSDGTFGVGPSLNGGAVLQKHNVKRALKATSSGKKCWWCWLFFFENFHNRFQEAEV